MLSIVLSINAATLADADQDSDTAAHPDGHMLISQFTDIPKNELKFLLKGGITHGRWDGDFLRVSYFQEGAG